MAELQLEEQLRGLHEMIVPLAKQQPGFVKGLWTRDPDTGKTHTTIVLDSEDAARQFKAMVESADRRQERARVGVTADFLVITEVLADA
jgi:hypothetical protein